MELSNVVAGERRPRARTGRNLYNHLNSNGHTVNDLGIMPIEEVVLADHEFNLVREEFWHWVQYILMA